MFCRLNFSGYNSEQDARTNTHILFLRASKADLRARVDYALKKKT